MRWPSALAALVAASCLVPDVDLDRFLITREAHKDCPEGFLCDGNQCARPAAEGDASSGDDEGAAEGEDESEDESEGEDESEDESEGESESESEGESGGEGESNGPAAEGEGPGVPDIGGVFLLALHTTIAPEIPIQILVSVEFRRTRDAGARLDFAFVPLDLSEGGHRRPIAAGAAIVEDVLVDAEGAFVAVLGTDADPVTMDGRANPFSGTPIVTSLQLFGTVESSSCFAGRAFGIVQQPLAGEDLAGSTFTAIRVDPRNDLPAPPHACPGA